MLHCQCNLCPPVGPCRPLYPQERTISDKPRARATTKEEILRAAARCFARDGVAATSMEDIAREAGITRMTLYRHMASRDALVVELALHDWEEMSTGLRELLDSIPSAEAKIVEGTVFAVMEISSRRYLQDLLRGTELDAWDADGDKTAFLDTFGSVIRPYVEHHRDELNSDVDDTVEWILRQVLLLVRTEPSRGLTPDEVRRQAKTFIVPSVLRSRG